MEFKLLFLVLNFFFFYLLNLFLSGDVLFLFSVNYICLKFELIVSRT